MTTTAANMLGLNYEDSDEDEENEPIIVEEQHESEAPLFRDHVKRTANGSETQKVNPNSHAQARPNDAPPPPGPALGPTMPSNESQDQTIRGTSPYTSNRLALRNLTMPPNPNFNIPHSPPGSPSPTADKKFANFLKLKEEGIHFNERLEKSSALRNPSLLQKLMDFAGINGEEQYASALPEGLALPTSFPKWAYADQLNISQQKLLKERQAEQGKKQRDALDFIPAAAPGATIRAANAAPYRGAPTSGAERIMLGLDKEKIRSVGVGTGSRQRDGAPLPARKNGIRARSRSPSRKRSRSR